MKVFYFDFIVMDYEKKYNHALEVVRELQKDWASTQNRAAREIELAFPELRESEDEKVMKILSDVFADSGDRFINEYERKLVASWLEKQKEQKPNYCHHEVDETGWTEEYRKAYYDGWNNCNMQHEQLKADQKPAEWSEEDEILRVRTINRLETLNFHGISGKEIRESIDWLKSLRPQPSWKPSEEQMNMLRAVINDPNNSGAESCQLALRGIYEQLKKL